MSSNSRTLSPLERLFAGVFLILERLSPVRYAQDILNSRVSRTAGVWFTDLYLLAWWTFEGFLYAQGYSQASSIVLFLLIFRGVELIQVYGNMLLFWSLRGQSIARSRYSPTRRLLIGFACYAELALLFGLFYWNYRSNMTGTIEAPRDTLYFSIATMTTVGFGDLAAVGWLRLIVAGQALCAFFFAIGLLGRLVSLLPTDDAPEP